MVTNNSSSTILAIGISLGMICGAAILARSIQDSHPIDRLVTVRGVAEKDVKADLAIWPIKVRVVGDNLLTTNQSADEAKKKLLAFLDENKIKAEDIASQDVLVTDRQANDYGQNKGALRYVVEHTITLRSKDVDQIRKISQMTDKLIAAGIILSSDAQRNRAGPRFLFTQLNSIKPTMLAEATKSARDVANQFAADSGSSVGVIKKASQGLFSISDRDQVSMSGENDGGYSDAADADPNKKVRVVVTIDYYLNQ